MVHHDYECLSTEFYVVNELEHNCIVGLDLLWSWPKMRKAIELMIEACDIGFSFNLDNVKQMASKQVNVVNRVHIFILFEPGTTVVANNPSSVNPPYIDVIMLEDVNDNLNFNNDGGDLNKDVDLMCELDWDDCVFNFGGYDFNMPVHQYNSNDFNNNLEQLDHDQLDMVLVDIENIQNESFGQSLITDDRHKLVKVVEIDILIKLNICNLSLIHI